MEIRTLGHASQNTVLRVDHGMPNVLDTTLALYNASTYVAYLPRTLPRILVVTLDIVSRNRPRARGGGA